MIRGAIFDLDGTLLDSMGIWQEIDKVFLGKRGIEVPTDYMQHVGTMSFPEAAQYTVKTFSLENTPEEIMQEWHEMAIDAYSHRVETKPDAPEFLRRLKLRGIRLGIATASNPEIFIPALRRNGILDLFDSVTTLREVSRGKGFPDIYQKEAEKLGCSVHECAVFEDHPAGIKGALEGGFITVAVSDVYAKEDEDALKSISHYYLEHYSDAEELLAPIL